MTAAATMLLTSDRRIGGDRLPRSPAAGVFSTASDGGYRDPRRFAALVSRYQTRVHRLVAGILGPAYSGDAEDATQEVFLLAYRKLDTFRGSAKVSTWLYRLAYNRAIDYRRRLARRRDDLPLPDEPASGDAAAPAADHRPMTPRAPLARLLADERGALVRLQLDRLAPKQRTAIYLHYWLGCTVREIAELMDSNPATIKSHLFRGRRALGRALARGER